MDACARAHAFVHQLSAQFGEPAISHGSGEPVVLDHAGHVQIFDGDVSVGTGQPVREFVEPVSSLIGDACVDALTDHKPAEESGVLDYV